MLILERPWTQQPQGPVRPAANFGAADILLIGDGRGNMASGGAQPTFSAQTMSGVDAGGRYFGTTASAGGVITVPNNARLQDGNCFGVAVVKFPVITGNMTIVTCSYDVSFCGTDFSWVIKVNDDGSVELALQNTATILQTAGSVISAGRIYNIAWSYNRTSGAAAIAVNGVLLTGSSVQATQTIAQQIGIGGYYDSDLPTGAAEKIFYLVGVWGASRSSAEVRNASLNPWSVVAPRRIYIPPATVPTLSASTFVPGSLTSTGWRPRVTAQF